MDDRPPFERLVESVQSVLAIREPVVVAVAGFGGAGKTTLADKLADRFQIDDRQIVRTDSLYSTTPHGRGLFDITDWTLLSRLLSEARSSDRHGRFRWWSQRPVRRPPMVSCSRESCGDGR